MQGNLNLYHYLTLIAFALFVMLFGLGTYPLANGKEGQYAEIAREMVSTGDFVTPYFNFIPHLDTPPLYYWLTSMSYAVFGITEFAARLVPASLALILVAGMLVFCQQCRKPRLGFVSAMMLLSSIGFVWIARSAVNDVLFACMTALLLFQFYQWFETTKAYPPLGCWALLGLAVLSKGLLAILIIIPIIILSAIFFENKRKSLGHFFHPLGLLLCGLICIPWYVLLYVHESELFTFYVEHEHMFRLLGLNVMLGDDIYPFYYYLGPWLLLIFPWMFLLLPKCVNLCKQSYYLDNLTKFCLIWLGWTLLIYSLFPVKSYYFIINMAVPTILLLAQQVETTLEQHKSALLRSMFYLATGIAVMVAMSFSVVMFKDDGILTNSEQLAIFAASCMFLFAVVSFIINICFRDKESVAFYLNVCLILPVLIVTVVIAQQVKDYYSEYNLADFVDKYYRDKPLYIYHNIEDFSSLIFYTINYVNLIEHDDLPRAANANRIPSKYAIARVNVRQFSDYAQHNAVLVTLNNGEQFVDFAQAVQPVKFCEVYRDGQALLLSNRDADCQRFAALKASQKV